MTEEELLRLYKSSKHYKERERYHALLLVKRGKKIREVAELFFVDEETIRSWVQKWDEEKSVQDKQRPGKPPTLTKEEQDELCKLVDENNPEKDGYNLATWDCIELVAYVNDHFNKQLSRETIRKILKKKGFRYIKSEYLFTKRDAEKRNEFVQEIFDLYESIQKGALHNTILMYCDQMSTKLHPKIGYVWTRNGKPLIETSCSHKRISTVAAIEPLIGKKVHAHYDRNNADSFIEFLTHLEKETVENIILVLDNYPVHHSRKVRDYLEKTGKITLKFLPTYSPDFNLIEWLWGYARKKKLNSKTHYSVEQLKETLHKSFDSIPAEKIKQICNLSILEKHRII